MAGSVILAAGLSMLAAAPAQAQAHDKAWWQAVAKAEYAVPAGAPLPALLDELTAMLGSSDAELRDDIAYSTLLQWIYVKRIVPVPARLRLAAEWQRRMRDGVPGPEGPGVLGRSFSALALAVLVGLDNEAPYLDHAAYAGVFDAALRYLRDERDVRGFAPSLGWMHSVAHTADLSHLACARTLLLERLRLFM